MTTESPFTIVNPVDGSLGFRLLHFEDDGPFNRPQRINYFSIIWIQEGSGSLKADFADHRLSRDRMVFFAPGHPFSITGSIKGLVMNFHTDFFCIIKHQKEVACDGVLFENPDNCHVLEIPDTDITSFHLLAEQIQKEINGSGVAQYDLLVSYLKIFLINAARLRLGNQIAPENKISETPKSNVLQELRAALEGHFRKHHSAGEYADILNITIKTLGRIVKDYFDKTLTELIADRIVLEAKRDLYLSTKPVKEIAYELGFKNEYHFSKYFKKWTRLSPQSYRSSLKNSWNTIADSPVEI